MTTKPTRYGVTYYPIGAAHVDHRIRWCEGGKLWMGTRREAYQVVAGASDALKARVVRLVPKKRVYNDMVRDLDKLVTEIKRTSGDSLPTLLNIVSAFWANPL